MFIVEHPQINVSKKIHAKTCGFFYTVDVLLRHQMYVCVNKERLLSQHMFKIRLGVVRK
jgi:hypothetical protein